ncbi:MAG: PD40 domain-containing protein [Bacteroidia bacterium]|nr:PD40 domain-containing protein [Bacteroidia bacterium]
MNLKTKLLLLALFGASSIIFAQGNKTKYREKFTEGNFLLLEKNYPMALRNFLQAYYIDSTNANINYKVGLCYLNSASEKLKAAYYLEKAVQGVSKKYSDFEPTEKKAPIMAHYYLGEAYRLVGKFKESGESFGKYKDLAKPNESDMKQLDREVDASYNAIEMMKNPTSVTIENLGDSINTEYPDYSPLLSADESVMLLTSRRPGSTGGEKTIDDQFYEDIYISYKKKDGSWSAASPIGPPINTNSNEAAVSISTDGQQMFIYKDSNGGDLYTSSLEGDKWTVPTPLGSDINTPFWETHACISADGNTIYFVSDRKGGQGGRDIYRCVKLPNGQWSLALNLGPTVNTAYDEDSPFIHPDGVTLYFSSNGHKTMGGFDIFYTSKNNEEGKWSAPVSMGYPINTSDDDIFYVPTTDGRHAYYSSSKSGGKGDKDIYRITLESAVSEPITLLKGYLNFDGKSDIASASNVRITATDVETGTIVQEVRPNSKTGKYIITLSPGASGKTYNVTYEAESFQPVSETIKIEPGSSYQELEREIGLKSINFESKTLGTVSVSGTITNKDAKPIPGAKITIKDNNTGQLVATYYSNATDGMYYFVLQRGQNYYLSYEAEGYLFQSENVNVPKEPVYSEINKVIVLEPIQKGTKITLKNLFFASGKSLISKQSQIELEKLYTLMKENADLVIEIAGHTDNAGDEKKNIKLSQDRANAVVTYLVKKGINAKQMVAKGYGPSQPVAKNTLPNGKPDVSGMAQNRRVEMKVLESK